MEFLKSFWPQLTMMLWSILASWAFHRYAMQRKQALRAAALAALEQTFGPPIDWANGKPLRLDAPDGYVLLREPATPDDMVRVGADAVLSWDVIVRVQDRYVHVIVRGRSKLWRDPQLRIEPLVLTELTELRARRALFNDAKAYQRAFGELPDRARLAKLELEPSVETID
jgi:hypothetical protein